MAGAGDLCAAGQPTSGTPSCAADCPGQTQKVLTETLRGMQADGLIERRILRESPPEHVEYALTDLGKTLQEPLAAICAWAIENGAAGHAASRG